MAAVRIFASSETDWVGMCLYPDRVRSDQISSEMTYTLYFLKSSMAFSSSQRSQTRPQGLWGEQRMAQWMCCSRSFFSMSA